MLYVGSDSNHEYLLLVAQSNPHEMKCIRVNEKWKFSITYYDTLTLFRWHNAQRTEMPSMLMNTQRNMHG
uniref:Putative RNA methyltransferase At5g51130 n=1 Tax=Rhizophora mucronata TaxID=61149 RepID=A0A2P2K2S7_RHIMU